MMMYDFIKQMNIAQLAEFQCQLNKPDCEHCPFGKIKPEYYGGLCTAWFLFSDVDEKGNIIE